MTETTWPAPADQPGAHIAHAWRCTRHGDITTRTKTTTNGIDVEVDECGECGHDDLPHRLRDAALRRRAADAIADMADHQGRTP